MDWLKSWNEALDYLEENLDKEISLEELSKSGRKNIAEYC